MSLSRFKTEDIVRVILFISMIGFTVVARTIDHAPNFAPVAAAGLFAGYLFRSRSVSYLAVIAAMLLSDLIIGYESVTMRIVVYATLVLPVMLGSLLRGRRPGQTAFALVGSSLLSSGFFYLTTNLAVWIGSGMYEHTAEGLVLCYTYALPFLRNTVAGDLFYTGIFFGIYAAVRLLVRRTELATI